ncbi:DUF3499 domain-containing protein [Corynebacterium ulceribovis]|uniref:DUF3499 domain-containing protein n=1 Tax=Corynebacterium ulceribovis TaxID=487732 RepID=UPI00047645A6|nr:DUF3499 domain-containing protein [Corynebacterium ulceribovis]
MSEFRRCSRPGCGKPAVATLTYAYSESTAVVGPLAAVAEPHSWDLCAYHAERITAPLGWELLKYTPAPTIDEEEELTALAEAVRRAGEKTMAEEPAQHRHPVHRGRHRGKGHLRLVVDTGEADLNE